MNHREKMLEIILPGLPVAWARAGRRGGITFTPAKQRATMAELKHVAAKVMGDAPPLAGPLAVTLRCQYPWPASWSAKKKAATKWRASRPDGDNLMKLVGDGLNGIVWVDDAVIVRQEIEKVYGDRAFTQITVKEVA